MRAVIFGLGALGVAACSVGTRNDPALEARMRVSGSQFVAGPAPVPAGGPEVAALDLLSTNIWPGYADKPVRGSLGASATAATLALSGDPGYWIVQAGVPDVAAPDLPTFRANASFSEQVERGAYTLEVHAVDAQGRFGPARRQTLTALPFAPSRAEPGELDVTLTWDTNSDLDLHVIDPNKNEIFHGAPSSRDAFSSAGSDPADTSNGSNTSFGVLDADSNAGCVLDGSRQEDVIWANAPPSGNFLVRVDTSSLCGFSNAHWVVRVTLHGAPLASASGISLDSDTWGAHDRGAGLFALEFDVP